MTDERRAHLTQAHEEVQRRQVSNSENLDRALLTLSSTGIALSVVLIKNRIPETGVTHFYILYLSWGLFLCVIFATLASFWTSQYGLKTQMMSIENELLKKPKDPKLEKREKSLFGITTGVGYLSCGAYFVAILLTILFIAVNKKEIF